MNENILIFLKKIIPKPVFRFFQPAYHFALGYLAALWHGRPSEKIIVVGVTGTTGKTTTVFLAAEILKNSGLKVGYITTAMFSDGEREWLNDKKMTMLGRFFTQKFLRQMVKNKCEVAIVETTSQGILQFRHRFINFDILVFTGLYPEHIEAHGGFENYKKAKGRLFAHLKNCRKKKINGREIVKTIIVNADDEHADYFLNFWAEKKIVFGIKHKALSLQDAEIVKAENISSDKNSSQFMVNGSPFKLNLLGDFNVINALAAISAVKILGVPMEKIREGLEKINGIPGRLEKISNNKGLTIIVDYAFEPNAVSKLYETVQKITHNKIIHVLGSCGGGRDKARRPKLGKLAGQNADYIIITNEDPYDEDPQEIIDEIFAGAVSPFVKGGSKGDFENPSLTLPFKKGEKVEGVDAFRILDRREAIKKALAIAGQNDVILVTGKGSEQAICVADGKKIPWDDRKVIREELAKISNA